VAEAKVDFLKEAVQEILEGTLLQKETLVEAHRDHQVVVICTLELEAADQAEQEIIIQVLLQAELVAQEQHQQLLDLQSQEQAEVEHQQDTDLLGQGMEELVELVDQVAAEQAAAEALLNQQETEHQQQLIQVVEVEVELII
jgi:hypothetical protein